MRTSYSGRLKYGVHQVVSLKCISLVTTINLN